MSLGQFLDTLNNCRFFCVLCFIISPVKLFCAGERDHQAHNSIILEVLELFSSPTKSITHQSREQWMLCPHTISICFPDHFALSI